MPHHRHQSGGMWGGIEHERNGLLFESGDIAGLAMAIEWLAKDRPLLRSDWWQTPSSQKQLPTTSPSCSSSMMRF